MPGPAKKWNNKEREEIRARMYAYWDEFYKQDTESRTARMLIQSLDDPESLFYNEDFLQQYLDDIERERAVKNTRKLVRK